MGRVRPCIYCDRPCVGRGTDGCWLDGIHRFYHMRCHAESQARALSQHDENNDQLEWKKEKEDVIEKHKRELDYYRRMLDEEKEKRKQFMNAVMQHMRDMELGFEAKLEEARRDMASKQDILHSEDKVIEKIEQMEVRREVKQKKLRDQVVSSVAALMRPKEGSGAVATTADSEDQKAFQKTWEEQLLMNAQHLE